MTDKLLALAKRWEDESTRLRKLYQPREDYPHTNGLAEQMTSCAEELRDVLGYKESGRA